MSKQEKLQWMRTADDEELLDTYLQYAQIGLHNLEGYAMDWGMTKEEILEDRAALRAEVLKRMAK